MKMAYVSGVIQAWENPDVGFERKPIKSDSLKTVKADISRPAVDPVLPKIMRECHGDAKSKDVRISYSTISR